jgi:hypothetical protein
VIPFERGFLFLTKKFNKSHRAEEDIQVAGRDNLAAEEKEDTEDGSHQVEEDIQAAEEESDT